MELSEARSDRDLLDTIEEAVRGHLLAALSEARTLSLKMDGTMREKLMDGLTKNFHPDQNASDLLSDAFYALKIEADELIETRIAEIKYPLKAAE